MENIFDKIRKGAKKFSLTKEEKIFLMQKIETHVKENPLTKNESAVPSPYAKFFTKLFSPLSKKSQFVSVAIVLLVILGGGTALAANSALPGDILYGVKIHVNERLESVLAIGAPAGARVEAEQANKRLQEVESLSAKGEISVQAKDEIKANFNKHADRVNKLVEDMRAKGDEEDATSVDSKFEKTLRTHNQKLQELSQKDKRNSEKIDEINAEINAHLNRSGKEKRGEVLDKDLEKVF